MFVEVAGTAGGTADRDRRDAPGDHPSPSAVATAGTGVAAAPLDVSAMTLVDVPALQPPAGVRRVIGLDTVRVEAALSPAGDVLAIAGDVHGVQLIHLPTGRGLAVRKDLACAEEPGYQRCLPKLAFSADGKHLAAWWARDGKLVTLAVPGGTTELTAKLDSIHRLAYLDDGRLVALGDDVSYAFDATGARSELLRAKGLARHVSRDGAQIVVDDDEPRIVDVATKQVVPVPNGVAIRGVAWLDATTWIAATRGEWPDVVTWRAGDRSVRTLASSKDARAVAGGEGVWGFAFPAPYDQVYVSTTNELYSVTLTGERRYRVPWLSKIGLESGGIVPVAGGVALLLGPCALRLDAAGQPASGPALCALRPSALAFDGNHLLSIPWGGKQLMTFDATTGALVASQLRERPYPSPSSLATLARDPALAARAAKALALPGVPHDSYQVSRDGRWLFANDAKDPQRSAIVELSSGRVRANLHELLASSDGSRIVQLRLDQPPRVDVRTVADDRLIRTIPVPTMVLSYLALSDDGKLLAAPEAGRVTVVEVDSGRTVFEAPCHASYSGHLALSHDGRLLVCDTTAGVEVYDVRAKKLVKRVPHDGSTNADTFAISDDNRQLAIGAGRILLVDL